LEKFEIYVARLNSNNFFLSFALQVSLKLFAFPVASSKPKSFSQEWEINKRGEFPDESSIVAKHFA
jgi:hypothetical protein